MPLAWLFKCTSHKMECTINNGHQWSANIWVECDIWRLSFHIKLQMWTVNHCQQKLVQLYGMLSQPRECIVNGPMASETLVRNLLFHHSIQIKSVSKVASNKVVIGRDKACMLQATNTSMHWRLYEVGLADTNTQHNTLQPCYDLKRDL